MITQSASGSPGSTLAVWIQKCLLFSSQLAQSFVPVFIKHLLWIERALPRAEDTEQIAGKTSLCEGSIHPSGRATEEGPGWQTFRVAATL